METDRIFEILYSFEDDLNENKLLEELKRIYEEEIKCSFQGPDKCNNENDNHKNKNNVIILFMLIN